MKRTETIVIGAGQAGLAMSRCLTDQGVDHVVFERGRVAERWQSERWDSLRLLTPNWQSRLPRWRYAGPDPEGFMTMPEVLAFLRGYASSFSAPIREEHTVLRVEPYLGEYRVVTDQGTWLAPTVVVATGHAATPHVPACARRLTHAVEQLSPTRYRNPDALGSGGVLVVGASASGVQLADELRRSGREVVLSVGEHTRMPRRYRGRDIMEWLDRTGALDRRWDEVHDLDHARRAPSLQLIGTPDNTSLDLGVLARRGVRIVGRTMAVEGAKVRFADDLEATTRSADARLSRLLARIDRHIAERRLDAPGADAPPPLELTTREAQLDLHRGFDTVIWATGFRRDYPWLALDVCDARGELRHDGGVTPAPGVFALGLSFMRRRKSSFIDGVGDDARAIANHVTTYLAGPSSAAA